MILFEQDPGSGVMIQEPYVDWTGYNTLQIQIFSLLDESRQIVLRVEDKRDERQLGDRTDLPLDVKPGYNLYEIPLDRIRDGPRERSLRLNKIRRVGVFSAGSDEPFMLFFSDFRLVDHPRPDSGVD